jgi:hypothetical protein
MEEFMKIGCIVFGACGVFIVLCLFFISDALYSIKRELRKMRRAQQKQRGD